MAFTQQQIVSKYRADTSQARREFGKLKEKGERDFQAIAGRIAKVTAGVAALTGAFQAASAGLESFKQRSQLQAATIGGNIEQIQSAAKGLITETEAMQFAAAAMNTEFDVSQKQMETAAKAMIALRNQGNDLVDVQNRVTQAIVEGNTEALKPLGIQAKASSGTVEGFNTVMEELAKQANSASYEMSTGADEMAQAQVEWKDAMEEAKSAIGRLVSEMAPLISALAKTVDLTRQLVTLGGLVGPGAGELAQQSVRETREANKKVEAYEAGQQQRRLEAARANNEKFIKQLAKKEVAAGNYPNEAQAALALAIQLNVPLSPGFLAGLSSETSKQASEAFVKSRQGGSARRNVPVTITTPGGENLLDSLLTGIGEHTRRATEFLGDALERLTPEEKERFAAESGMGSLSGLQGLSRFYQQDDPATNADNFSRAINQMKDHAAEAGPVMARLGQSGAIAFQELASSGTEAFTLLAQGAISFGDAMEMMLGRILTSIGTNLIAEGMRATAMAGIYALIPGMQGNSAGLLATGAAATATGMALVAAGSQFGGGATPLGGGGGEASAGSGGGPRPMPASASPAPSGSSEPITIVVTGDLDESPRQRAARLHKAIRKGKHLSRSSNHIKHR